MLFRSFALPEGRLDSRAVAADRYVRRCYPSHPIENLAAPSLVSVRIGDFGAAILIYEFTRVTDAFVAFEIGRDGAVVRAYRLRVA